MGTYDPNKHIDGIKVNIHIDTSARGPGKLFILTMIISMYGIKVSEMYAI